MRRCRNAVFPLLLLCSAACGFLVLDSGPVGDFVRYKRLPGDPKTPSNPVVLVPGDGGTHFDANLTGKPSVVHYLCDSKTSYFFDLWLNMQSFAPISLDCWADNMRLVFNTTTNSSQNSPGVDVRVPDIGHTDPVEWLDPSHASQGNYFAHIADTLVQWGYRRGKDLIGAAYDWRKSPPELENFYLELKATIVRTYYYNQKKPVVVVGHSMGNPVMNYFYHAYVDSEWKTKYIHSHIALSGPWGGSMQIVRLFAYGYNMDYLRIVLPPSELREMQRSFTSSAFLFPRADVWSPNELLAVTAERNYTVQDAHQFFDDIKYPLGKIQYDLVHPSLLIDAPGVDVHCAYGTGVQTPANFTWSKGYFPDYAPAVSYGDGDGTVNINSLRVCGRWNATNNGHVVTINELPKADHMSILQDPRTIALLKSILYP